MNKSKNFNINKEIGLRARTFRKKLGYNQEHLAEMLGLSRASYVNLEAGRTSFNPSYLFTICRIFKCTPNDLFPKATPITPKAVYKKRMVYKIQKSYSKV